ncbi:hypothetical protein RND71_036536 [Anisodus tanguticus]|uniref:PRONE domain-containing protein n=1 Tax=Anisodus tanguticus TaxID=243964 RepID=A0AAE1R499_9SOLA|nr:hypothetical protein RND71_036536 [Anisodus tanguticus]
MVREIYKISKSRSFNFRKMFEGRHAHSNVVLENGHGKEMHFRTQGVKSSSALELQNLGSIFNRSVDPILRFAKEGARSRNIHKDNKQASDMEMMKKRSAILLLGEDMSCGGKGVPSALALSNAITNLATSVFGEQCKLEPMSQERKARWRKEINWLLFVSDYIVEFVPSQQKSKDGTNMEVMVTQQRRDLLKNIPALKKLDAMLILNENEFWYVSRDADEYEKGVQRNDKWWLPLVKVPPEGLFDEYRKWLQYQKDCVNQDIGHCVLESYSRVLESLANTVMSCIEDVLYADSLMQDPSLAIEKLNLSSADSSPPLPLSGCQLLGN